ncbi:HGGxSTG domain-containing protein [Nitratireductor aquimarinus]|uniref:HGGxSTG domain-containing protein n=1 Tax=Nitratireductor aquimarinus TaxID=889300 RepID=A0ABU4AEI7_9HYPH|nr:HGGxSTG domain-containing protein [Nitratireductor aquimarinus]MDV6224668.1 HGGxSTG domain-containing protein [Nitratireductor aquimarinus]
MKRTRNRSAEGREKSRKAISEWNARRAEMPRCGARRKSDGEPCQNIGMANGRCRLHGGKTPKGEGWRKPQWPATGSAERREVKLRSKLAMLEERRKERERKLARMSPEERQRWQERWGGDVIRPGSAEERQAAKAARKAGKETRGLLQGLLRDRPAIAPQEPNELTPNEMERSAAQQQEGPDMSAKEDVGAVEEALLRRVRTEGVEAAYSAALSICRDKTAPAPAKATAATTLFRVAGYFEKRDSGHTKDLHEMTPEEIGRELRRLESMARGETGGGKDHGGVFD